MVAAGQVRDVYSLGTGNAHWRRNQLDARAVRKIEVRFPGLWLSCKCFQVQYEKDGKWLTIASATEMGEWKQNIKPVTSKKFRLVILDKAGFSGIKEFQLYANNFN